MSLVSITASFGADGVVVLNTVTDDGFAHRRVDDLEAKAAYYRHGAIQEERRMHPEWAETVQAELEETRTEVPVARQVGDEQVKQALVGEWRGRLRRVVAAARSSWTTCGVS